MTDLFDTIIYHANCFDGLTSAWVARQTSPNAEMVAATYGDMPPHVEGKRVLIVDFSYPQEVLLGMLMDAADILVLDHHKTAAENLEGLPPGVAVFDMERSGAGLAWDYLMTPQGPVSPEGLAHRRRGLAPKLQRPPIVDHVEDRDLWRFAIPETKAYHASMSCYPMTFEAWDEIASTAYGVLLTQGNAVLRYTNTIARKFSERAYVVVLDGVECWAINCQIELASEAADTIMNREPKRPVVMWRYDGDSGDYYCSLRSRDDRHPVDTVARTFGGGGHRNAAGFNLPHPPLPLKES